MLDTIFILATGVFFFAAWAFAKGCERL